MTSLKNRLKEIRARVEAVEDRGPWKLEAQKHYTPKGSRDAVETSIELGKALSSEKWEEFAHFKMSHIPHWEEVASKEEAHSIADVPMLLDALEIALEALEFYADRTNWERIDGHTRWSSNLKIQDWALYNTGGGRARLALAKIQERMK